MMTFRLLIVVMLMLTTRLGVACTCAQVDPFCTAHKDYDLTVSALVLDSFPHGVRVKVLQRLHGSEPQDTLIIWDHAGPYNSCLDSGTEARVGYYRRVGDTMIVAMNKIDTVRAPWEVVGDYGAPGAICVEDLLLVERDTVIGFIAGVSGSPYNRLHYPYDSFLLHLPSAGEGIGWVGIDGSDAGPELHVYPVPADDMLHVVTTSHGPIAVFSSTGQLVFQQRVTSGHSKLPLQQLPAGWYLLRFTTPEGAVASRKVMR